MRTRSYMGRDLFRRIEDAVLAALGTREEISARGLQAEHFPDVHRTTVSMALKRLYEAGVLLRRRSNGGEYLYKLSPTPPEKRVRGLPRVTNPVGPRTPLPESPAESPVEPGPRRDPLDDLEFSVLHEAGMLLERSSLWRALIEWKVITERPSVRLLLLQLGLEALKEKL